MSVFRARGRGRWPEERERPQKTKERPQKTKERPQKTKERPQRGEGGGAQRRAPRSSVLTTHQPSGHRHFCITLWVTSTARLATRRSWSLLPPQVQAPAKTSAACCLADALALPWAHHHSTSASGEALQYGGDCNCLTAWGWGAILNYFYCWTEEPDCVSINSAFLVSCTPWIMTLKRLRL